MGNPYQARTNLKGEESTQFLGGLQRFMRMEINGKASSVFTIIKWVTWIGGMIFTILTLTTDRWIGTTERAVVSADRIERLERITLQQDEKNSRTFAREDVVRIRLDGIDRRLENIERLLMEEKRRR